MHNNKLQLTQYHPCKYQVITPEKACFRQKIDQSKNSAQIFMLGNLTVQIFTKFHAIFLKCTSRFLAIATEPETLMNHSRNLKTFSFMTYADTTIGRENKEIFIFKFFNQRASPKWLNLQKIEVLVKSSRYTKKYFHISRNMKTKRMLPIYEDIELCS